MTKNKKITSLEYWEAQKSEWKRKTNSALEKLKLARQEVDLRGPRGLELLDEAIRLLQEGEQ